MPITASARYTSQGGAFPEMASAAGRQRLGFLDAHFLRSPQSTPEWITMRRAIGAEDRCGGAFIDGSPTSSRVSGSSCQIAFVQAKCQPRQLVRARLSSGNDVFRLRIDRTFDEYFVVGIGGVRGHREMDKSWPDRLMAPSSQ